MKWHAYLDPSALLFFWRLGLVDNLKKGKKGALRTEGNATTFSMLSPFFYMLSLFSTSKRHLERVWGDIFCQILWSRIFFLHLLGDKPLWGGGVKIIWGSSVCLHFHYSIYLETANNHKSKVFLLRISSGNMNASGDISSWYLQIQ